jgi:hypothetical protein
MEWEEIMTKAAIIPVWRGGNEADHCRWSPDHGS